MLLLDEPFGALDAITREQLQREIAAILAHSPKTAVFVTHNMDEAIFFSDRILVMSPRPHGCSTRSHRPSPAARGDAV